MTSPTVPASWTPEQTAAVAAFRDGLNSTDVVKMREEMGKAPPAEYPKGVQLKAVEIPRVAVPELEEKVDGTVKAEWLEPENKTGDEPVLIYVHGGGYCIMSPQSHRGITGGLAAHGVRVLSLDYRMAPEHPFPAPIVDSLSAYKYLLSQGVPASKICMSGDSAGGGLTLATAMYLRDHPEFAPQMAGLAPISPWIELTTSSPSVYLGDEFDADIINRGKELNTGMPVAYSGGVDERPSKDMLPLFSPFFDTSDAPMPPILTSLATVDRLFAEDLAYFVPRLAKGDAKIQVDVYEHQFHIFQFLTWLPQSATCFKRMTDFIKNVTQDAASAKSSISHIAYDGSVKSLDGGVDTLRGWLRNLVERAEKDEGWQNDARDEVKDLYRRAAI